MRADSPAYATHIRLMPPRLIAAASETAGCEAVRSIRVLAAGAPAPPASSSSPASSPPVPEAPVRTRETASPGYQQALASHQASRPERVLAPRIATAIEQRTQAPSCVSRRKPSATGKPRSRNCGRRQRGRRPRTAAVFARCGGPVLSGLAPRLRPRLERPVPRDDCAWPGCVRAVISEVLR
ncbi:hypothetical protein [Streptomyces hygroscopicus]|uniref:hypothetical protein n=1 Tax=Streptomyces hygroscopicus TaxID=1912 RepID=UPI003F4D70FB